MRAPRSKIRGELSDILTPARETGSSRSARNRSPSLRTYSTLKTFCPSPSLTAKIAPVGPPRRPRSAPGARLGQANALPKSVTAKPAPARRYPSLLSYLGSTRHETRYRSDRVDLTRSSTRGPEGTVAPVVAGSNPVIHPLHPRTASRDALSESSHRLATAPKRELRPAIAPIADRIIARMRPRISLRPREAMRGRPRFSRRHAGCDVAYVCTSTHASRPACTRRK